MRSWPKTWGGALVLAACSAGPGTYNPVPGSDGPVGEAEVGDGPGSDPGSAGDGGTAATLGTDGNGSSTVATTDAMGSSTSGGGNDGPSPSAGCGAAVLESGLYTNVAVEVRGDSRRYDIFVPPSHDGINPLSLVLDFHDGGQGPGAQANRSMLRAAADANGLVVVNPEGDNASWNGGVCCGSSAADGIDDVAFVRAVLDAVGTNVCIDERRVFATGFGNGALMAHRLACEAADVIAAIAPVAGVLGLAPEACLPTRAVSVMHFHGTNDPAVPYGGGGPFGTMSVADSTATWVQRDGCGPTSSPTFSMDDTTCETWGPCTDATEVTLCTVSGMRHCWPGLGKCSGGGASTTLPATDAMLTFFAAHPLP